MTLQSRRSQELEPVRSAAGEGGVDKDLGLRDELIDKVQHGKLTPAQAEAEAVRLGLDPFETCPDPDQFDPMAEARWTLPMAVAWISWRSWDRVREYWDAYRQ